MIFHLSITVTYPTQGIIPRCLVILRYSLDERVRLVVFVETRPLMGPLLITRMRGEWIWSFGGMTVERGRTKYSEANLFSSTCPPKFPRELPWDEPWLPPWEAGRLGCGSDSFMTLVDEQITKFHTQKLRDLDLYWYLVFFAILIRVHLSISNILL